MILHSMDVPKYPIKAIPPHKPAVGKKGKSKEGKSPNAKEF